MLLALILASSPGITLLHHASPIARTFALIAQDTANQPIRPREARMGKLGGHLPLQLNTTGILEGLYMNDL